MTMAVKSRRSIRHFTSRRVPRHVVQYLIDLAKWAPSAHNSQPWRTIVVDGKRMKQRLASEMRKVWVSDLLKDGCVQSEADTITKQKSWDTFVQGAVVIIVCLTMKDMHLYADPVRREAEHMMAVQSVAAFVQTLLLVTHDHGLGAGWFCAPLFCQSTVRRTLKLPKTLEPQALVAIGYPDEEPAAPTRKSVDEFCVFTY